MEEGRSLIPMAENAGGHIANAPVSARDTAAADAARNAAARAAADAARNAAARAAADAARNAAAPVAASGRRATRNTTTTRGKTADPDEKGKQTGVRFKSRNSIIPEPSEMATKIEKIFGKKINPEAKSEISKFIYDVFQDTAVSRKEYYERKTKIKTEKDRTEQFGFNELDQQKFKELIEETPGIEELDLESPMNLIDNAKKIAKDKNKQTLIMDEYHQIKKDMKISDIYDFEK